jgi:hypothetical protein
MSTSIPRLGGAFLWLAQVNPSGENFRITEGNTAVTIGEEVVPCSSSCLSWHEDVFQERRHPQAPHPLEGPVIWIVRVVVNWESQDGLNHHVFPAFIDKFIDSIEILLGESLAKMNHH